LVRQVWVMARANDEARMTKECRNPNDERESIDSDDFELRH